MIRGYAGVHVRQFTGQLSLFELDARPEQGEPASLPDPSEERPQPVALRFEPPQPRATEAIDPLTRLVDVLAKLGTDAARPVPALVDLRQARDDWLRRLQTARRSESALTA